MEQKKNPNMDLNRNSTLYFVMGLTAVMLLIYVALEWKTYDKPYEYANEMNKADGLIDEEPPIFVLNTPPPPPPPVAPVIIEIAPDDTDEIETEITSSESNEEAPIIDAEDVYGIEEIVDEVIPFAVIENVPVFPGCEDDKDKRACFQKMMNNHIRKTFRYPEIEQEMGIQGRVSIVFTIQKDGSIGEIKMRGPNKNLEKEAARIISRLPKMTPGKQRGKAVKVPFSLPINFVLQ